MREFLYIIAATYLRHIKTVRRSGEPFYKAIASKKWVSRAGADGPNVLTRL